MNRSLGDVEIRVAMNKAENSKLKKKLKKIENELSMVKELQMQGKMKDAIVCKRSALGEINTLLIEPKKDNQEVYDKIEEAEENLDRELEREKQEIDDMGLVYLEDAMELAQSDQRIKKELRDIVKRLKKIWKLLKSIEGDRKKLDTRGAIAKKKEALDEIRKITCGGENAETRIKDIIEKEEIEEEKGINSKDFIDQLKKFLERLRKSIDKLEKDLEEEKQKAETMGEIYLWEAQDIAPRWAKNTLKHVLVLLILVRQFEEQGKDYKKYAIAKKREAVTRITALIEKATTRNVSGEFIRNLEDAITKLEAEIEREEKE